MRRKEVIMDSLPQRKVGIVACSGEEVAEGTVTRLATLKVLHELRRGETVTICLPLFLAGNEGNRNFARSHPTITVDGCDLRCAAHGTEMYSGKPAASVVVSDLLTEHGIAKPEGRRCLNAAGKKAVEITAQRLAALVDEVLGKPDRVAAADAGGAPDSAKDSVVVACSCGSGIPVRKLEVAGQPVEVVALPLILDQLRKAHRQPNEALAQDLLEMVKVYNYVPPEAEAAWRDVLVKEYAAHCARKG
jgi:uncharacterized metal-binding protein